MKIFCIHILSILIANYFHIPKIIYKLIAFLEDRTEFDTEEKVLFLQPYQDPYWNNLYLFECF